MKSVLGKNWKIKNKSTKGSLVDRILKTRDIDDIESPLENLKDPKKLKDLEKSVKRIKQAVEDKERIMIFGDYDVDGVTSSAILFSVLQELGAQVSVRLPNRFTDGYGLNVGFIDECKKLDVGLLLFWIFFLIFSLNANRNVVYFAIAAYFVIIANIQQVIASGEHKIFFQNKKMIFILSAGLKVVLIINMLMGRVEAIAIIVLLLPVNWFGKRRK